MRTCELVVVAGGYWCLQKGCLGFVLTKDLRPLHATSSHWPRYVFPDNSSSGIWENGDDWQYLGAKVMAAQRSQRLDKAAGLIRDPDVLRATIQRRVQASGGTAVQAFARFRSASKIAGVDGGFVITREDLKRALVYMQINATGTCVELLFR